MFLDGNFPDSRKHNKTIKRNTFLPCKSESSEVKKLKNECEYEYEYRGSLVRQNATYRGKNQIIQESVASF